MKTKPTSYLGPALTVSLVRESKAQSYPLLNNPAEAAAALAVLVPDDGREHFGIVMLDVRHRALGVLSVSVGCLTASLVHPREVFGPALVGKAASVILWHNHPSGDPEPSTEDLAITRKLAAGGVVLGIEVVDHLIIGTGSGRFVSLKERGVL